MEPPPWAAIACPDDIASLIGEPLVRTFRREAPLANFATRPAILDRALRAIRRGEADVALDVFQHLPRVFAASELYEDEYFVIARRDHPRIRGAVDLETYAEIGHVFVGDPDGGFVDEPTFDRETIEATYGAMPGPHLIRTHAYVGAWETAMLIVASGDVLADCPRRLALRYADTVGLQVLDPPYPPFRFTVQAVRSADTDDAGLDWLMGAIAAAVAA